ncbi:DUF4221 domain-containing protein [Algoriphagus sp. AGSA1]|uniref:DUF4221 family protein n=1 Tax=Algoriphagus sp. AGSA1 TaxID=2907213 RepID=UPI001F1D50E0|nr:DUF4221 family protein [Algoriphagus sp. AGSA1]MCE7057471.1 DUF4221 domain-containing protein [Algoriphagus sp. AGSA1]
MTRFLGSITFIVLTFILTSACSKREELLVEEIEKYREGEINLALDDSTSLDFLRTSYLGKGDKEYLYHHNEFKKNIQVYDLERGLIDHEISYPHIEPLGIKMVQGITVVSADSIFLFPSLFIRGSLLINNQGEIISRYLPPKTPKREESIVNHSSFGSMPTLLLNRELRFIQLPLFEISNPANINDKFRFEVTYSIDSNSTSEIPESAFPEFYHNKIWAGHDIQLSRTINKKNQIIYSWKYLDSLTVVADGQSKSVYAKSDYITKEAVPFSMIPSSDQKTKYVIENTKYYGIYYDEFRDVYYRTVQLPGKYDINEIPKEMDALRDFSVIVLDSTFNKINEVRFPGGIYNIYRAFVGKRGFYLPKNNIMNPDLKEDILSIDIFDFTAHE